MLFSIVVAYVLHANNAHLIYSFMISIELTDLYCSRISGMIFPLILHVLYLNTGLPCSAAIVAVTILQFIIYGTLKT